MPITCLSNQLIASRTHAASLPRSSDVWLTVAGAVAGNGTGANVAYDAHTGGGPVEDDIRRGFDDTIAVAVRNGTGAAPRMAEATGYRVLAGIRVEACDVWKCRSVGSAGRSVTVTV